MSQITPHQESSALWIFLKLGLVPPLAYTETTKCSVFIHSMTVAPEVRS